MQSKQANCPCGWRGPMTELRKAGCVTYGDTWYECPKCGADSSQWKVVPMDETATKPRDVQAQ